MKLKLTTPKKSGPRVLTVKDAWHLTPNMIRVTFAGSELADIKPGCEGANCKLMLPEAGESREDFTKRLEKGKKITRRTYTVRHIRPDAQEMDIDFVDHGDNGPASGWAKKAKAGDFIGFAGPGPVKMDAFYADYYVVAADSSAIPVAAATLEAMPRDAKGIAIFEVPTEADRQDINAPEGIDMRWLIHENPYRSSPAQEEAIRALKWPKGRVQTCIAGESGVIKSLRQYILKDRDLSKKDAYISGYWKIGMIEDEHQAMKRAEANA